jgi:hypothetical protein
MSRLIEELKNKKEKSLFNPDQEINKDMKLLMEGETQREQTVLSNIGIDGALKAAQTKKGFDIERKNLEDKYNSELIFTEAEIKELCLDYRLKFLNSKRYIGPVDSELGTKLADFSDEHKLSLDTNAGMRDDFYVAAPYNCFELDWKPVPPKDPDPLLFYCVDRDYKNPELSKYLLIHKWGNDFSPLRLIKGFIYRNPINWFFSNVFIFAMLWSLLPAFHGATFIPMLLWSTILGLATVAALSIAHWGGNNGNPMFRSWALKLSHKGWNSRYANKDD